MPMKLLARIACLSLIILAGCGKNRPEGSSAAVGAGTTVPVGGTGVAPTGGNVSLVEARKGFKTKLVKQAPPKEPVDVPPPNVFSLVKYDSPVGPLAAYLTPDPKNRSEERRVGK